MAQSVRLFIIIFTFPLYKVENKLFTIKNPVPKTNIFSDKGKDTRNHITDEAVEDFNIRHPTSFEALTYEHGNKYFGNFHHGINPQEVGQIVKEDILQMDGREERLGEILITDDFEPDDTPLLIPDYRVSFGQDSYDLEVETVKTTDHIYFYANYTQKLTVLSLDQEREWLQITVDKSENDTDESELFPAAPISTTDIDYFSTRTPIIDATDHNQDDMKPIDKHKNKSQVGIEKSGGLVNTSPLGTQKNTSTMISNLRKEYVTHNYRSETKDPKTIDFRNNYNKSSFYGNSVRKKKDINKRRSLQRETSTIIDNTMNEPTNLRHRDMNLALNTTRHNRNKDNGLRTRKNQNSKPARSDRTKRYFQVNKIKSGNEHNKFRLKIPDQDLNTKNERSSRNRKFYTFVTAIENDDLKYDIAATKTAKSSRNSMKEVEEYDLEHKPTIHQEIREITYIDNDSYDYLKSNDTLNYLHGNIQVKDYKHDDNIYFISTNDDYIDNNTSTGTPYLSKDNMTNKSHVNVQPKAHLISKEINNKVTYDSYSDIHKRLMITSIEKYDDDELWPSVTYRSCTKHCNTTLPKVRRTRIANLKNRTRSKPVSRISLMFRSNISRTRKHKNNKIASKVKDKNCKEYFQVNKIKKNYELNQYSPKRPDQDLIVDNERSNKNGSFYTFITAIKDYDLIYDTGTNKTAKFIKNNEEYNLEQKPTVDKNTPDRANTDYENYDYFKGNDTFKYLHESIKKRDYKHEESDTIFISIANNDYKYYDFEHSTETPNLTNNMTKAIHDSFSTKTTQPISKAIYNDVTNISMNSKITYDIHSEIHKQILLASTEKDDNDEPWPDVTDRSGTKHNTTLPKVKRTPSAIPKNSTRSKPFNPIRMMFLTKQMQQHSAASIYYLAFLKTTPVNRINNNGLRTGKNKQNKSASNIKGDKSKQYFRINKIRNSHAVNQLRAKRPDQVLTTNNERSNNNGVYHTLFTAIKDEDLIYDTDTNKTAKTTLKSIKEYDPEHKSTVHQVILNRSYTDYENYEDLKSNDTIKENVYRHEEPYTLFISITDDEYDVERSTGTPNLTNDIRNTVPTKTIPSLRKRINNEVTSKSLNNRITYDNYSEMQKYIIHSSTETYHDVEPWPGVNDRSGTKRNTTLPKVTRTRNAFPKNSTRSKPVSRIRMMFLTKQIQPHSSASISNLAFYKTAPVSRNKNNGLRTRKNNQNKGVSNIKGDKSKQYFQISKIRNGHAVNQFRAKRPDQMLTTNNERSNNNGVYYTLFTAIKDENLIYDTDTNKTAKTTLKLMKEIEEYDPEHKSTVHQDIPNRSYTDYENYEDLRGNDTIKENVHRLEEPDTLLISIANDDYDVEHSTGTPNLTTDIRNTAPTKTTPSLRKLINNEVTNKSLNNRITYDNYSEMQKHLMRGSTETYDDDDELWSGVTDRRGTNHYTRVNNVTRTRSAIPNNCTTSKPVSPIRMMFLTKHIQPFSSVSISYLAFLKTTTVNSSKNVVFSTRKNKKHKGASRIKSDKSKQYFRVNKIRNGHAVNEFRAERPHQGSITNNERSNFNGAYYTFITAINDDELIFETGMNKTAQSSLNSMKEIEEYDPEDKPTVHQDILNRVYTDHKNYEELKSNDTIKENIYKHEEPVIILISVNNGDDDVEHSTGTLNSTNYITNDTHDNVQTKTTQPLSEVINNKSMSNSYKHNTKLPTETTPIIITRKKLVPGIRMMFLTTKKRRNHSASKIFTRSRGSKAINKAVKLRAGPLISDPWSCYHCGLRDGIYGSPTCYNTFDNPDQREFYKRRHMHQWCSGDSRWHGQCFKRYLDVGVLYNERGCRTWPPTRGSSFASERLMKLEYLLKDKKDGCVASPHAVLVRFSDSVRLYARFHVCVCSGNLCNGAGRFSGQSVVPLILLWQWSRLYLAVFQ